MTKTLSITQARKDLPTLVANANKKWDEYEITVNGSVQAVLLSKSQFDSIRETEEILADPQLMADIRQGEKDIAEGRVYDWEDVKKELGLNVQTKNNRPGKKKAKRNF